MCGKRHRAEARARFAAARPLLLASIIMCAAFAAAAQGGEMKAQGWEVYHIMDVDKAKEHPFTPPARVVNGQLTYASREQAD